MYRCLVFQFMFEFLIKTACNLGLNEFYSLRVKLISQKKINKNDASTMTQVIILQSI